MLLRRGGVASATTFLRAGLDSRAEESPAAPVVAPPNGTVPPTQATSKRVRTRPPYEVVADEVRRAVVGV